MNARVWLVTLFVLAAFAACSGGGSLPTGSGSAQHQTAGKALPQATSGTYANAVLADHPTQYYPLNEASGPTAFDQSPTRVNGLYEGSVTYSQTGPLLDETSTAVWMPGHRTSAYVSLPNPNMRAGTSYTIQTWVYPIFTSDVDYNTQYITVWGANSAHRLMLNNSGTLLSQFHGNYFSKHRLSGSAWHQVVFVYNAQLATESYYIDGKLDSSAALSTSAATFASAYYLGQYDTSVNYKWYGRLAQHAVFPRALTGTQIASLYTAAGYSLGPTPTPSSTPNPSSSPSPTPTPAPSSSPGVYYDWATFGGNLQRTGYNSSERTLTTSNVSGLHEVWSANLGGVIDAQPIVAANVQVGSSIRNLLLVGAENGVFEALDASSGAVLWRKQLGTYSDASCSDLPVFGITGTATLNKAGNLVYVADGGGQVHAFNLATGAEALGWPVSVGTVSQEHIYSGLAYNPANGLLYVETAGYCDITPYHGRIVAINTSSASIVATFTPSGTASGGGIWGEGGAAIDAATNDVFVATGNSFVSGAYSESMVRLSSMLAVKASNFPGLASGDNDFSGTAMLYNAGTCPQQVDAKNKNGNLYTWSAGSIANGPSQSLTISPAKSFTGVAAYDPVTNMVYIGNPTATGSYTYGLLAFSVQANCTLALTWQRNAGISNQNDTSEQVVIANGVAYFTNGMGKQVYAFNAQTGAALWNSGSTVTGYTFAAPTIDGGHVYVASYDNNVYAFGL